MDRRSFVDFLGKGALVVPIVPSILSSCGFNKSGQIDSSIFPSTDDDVLLAEGLNYEVLISRGDFINDKMTFGSHNDYIAYLPTDTNEGILWVNHKYVTPLFTSGYDGKTKGRHRNMILGEMQEIGGTILKVRQERGKWKPVFNDPINNRLTAASKIPFEWPELVAGYRSATGTLSNCAGGITPWGTILTCEENFSNFYGDYNYETQERTPSRLNWERFFPKHAPQHYGWVVEVDVNTGGAKKHVSLGRMEHECATVKELADGRVVVYTGDDRNDGCLYKHISDMPGQISPGKLYVADCDNGRWEWIDISRPELVKFNDQTELMIRTREAALLVGGTELDRPEDIEIDLMTGDILVSLTNNKPKGNYHGSIMKIMESGDYDSLEFAHDTFLTGGENSGFSCPDNMAFDNAGNLWFASDISSSSMGKAPYVSFGNNGLFVLVRNGDQAGEILQVASAPNDAEFTGIFFTPDGETLFLSVQHPGEKTKDLANLTSNWPGGGTTIPLSSVIAIQGDLLEGLQAIV
ncbi:MAG: DUF839 domain-containing protein [Cytophagales bacterium]|nr:DUF839 domain-containing protein [Cytophagales bacterium]